MVDVKGLLAQIRGGKSSSLSEAAIPSLGPEISLGSINIVAAASDESNLQPDSDNLVGGVDVSPIDTTTSVFLELEDVVKVAVKEPTIHSGSVNVVVTASDSLEASSSPNAQGPPAWWSALEVVDVAIGGSSPVDDRAEDDDDDKDGDTTVY